MPKPRRARRRRTALGSNLDALLGDAAALVESTDQQSQVRRLPLESIRPGSQQPRRQGMAEEDLRELADSIHAQGVLQPVLVRPLVGEKGFELIAGERRWRAAALARLEEIPALVLEVGNAVALAMSIIENIQRQDLNVVEEARALQRLQQEFNLSQQQVAEAVGRSRPGVANLLRLLELEPEVLELLVQGKLEMGHGRALLALPVSIQLLTARQIIDAEMSVRRAEALVRRLLEEEPPARRPAVKRDPDLELLERELSEQIGVRTSIYHSRAGNGRVVLRYGSLEYLRRRAGTKKDKTGGARAREGK